MSVASFAGPHSGWGLTLLTSRPPEREKAEISDDLVRIAIGCEDAADLRDDLAQALEKV